MSAAVYARSLFAPSFWFPFMVLSLLAGLSFWLEQATEVPLQADSSARRHDPDILADEFILHRHDDTGRLQYRLSAPHLEHYPDDDSTLITSPRLVQFRPKGPRLTLQGDTARVTEAGRRVFLQGNVIVTRAAFKKRPELQMKTSELTVLPEAGQAFNDKPVNIREGKSRMTGIGLTADHNRGVFQVLARVRANYERPRHAP